MRRRHSQGPRREAHQAPIADTLLHRLILRLAPAVDSAGRVSATFPGHIGAALAPPARLTRAVFRRAAARPRLLRNVVVSFLALVILLGGAAAVLLAGLTRGQPGWWRVMPPLAVTEHTGNRVQNELTTLITSARPLDGQGCSVPWGLAINPEQANAWLNTKLRDWVRSRAAEEPEPEPNGPANWIDQIREVQVDFNGSRIALGARIDHRGEERIFSATLVPQVRDDGSLWMLAQNVQIGRLSVPASWVLPGAANSTPPEPGPGEARIVPASQTENVDLASLPEAQAMFEAFSGRKPMIETPTLRLPDGRSVRLLSLTTRDDGMLIVTCRTERR